MNHFTSFVATITLSLLSYSNVLAQQNYSAYNNKDQECMNIVAGWAQAVADGTKGWSMYDFIEGRNYKITSRYNDGTPFQISFDYVLGTRIAGTVKVDGTYTAYVLFFEGLPFAVHGGRMQNGEYKQFPYGRPITKNPPPRFSETEKAKIRSIYKTFETQRQLTSASYQEVIRKHNNYPAEYNMKNCLEIVSKVEPKVYLRIIDNPDFGGGMISTRHKEVIEFGSGMSSYYRNKSTHPIVIKGIYKKLGAGGQYEYYDESIILQPGQMTDYFVIRPEYDVNSLYNVQFFGDVGTIVRSKE